MIQKLALFFILCSLFMACVSTDRSLTSAVIEDEKEMEKTVVQVIPDLYPYKAVADSLAQFFIPSPKGTAHGVLLQGFYAASEYQPVWTSENVMREGLQLIKNARYHGLNPNEYGMDAIGNLFQQWLKNKQHAQTALALEIKLSQGILYLCTHISQGKLSARDFHSSWNYPEKSQTLPLDLILSLIREGKTAVIEGLLEPQGVLYASLKAKLEELHQQETNNKRLVPIRYPGFIIQQGDSNKFVGQLKMRLGMGDSENWAFTNALEDSIKAFQYQHGLVADGKPGKKTYAFLEWSDQRYREALRVNMERLRWIPDSLLLHGVVVNIPAYQLVLRRPDTLIFTTRVIVGKAKNETPVLHADINYLVFNPCWTVPNSIAVDKMLPRLKKDSSYLKNRNMFLGINGVEQVSEGIDFSQYSKENFPYKIYQRTGDNNALGKVKFMFANRHTIYLHDTPNKNLFSKDSRAFSHGCIRVQDAMSLADLLLYKENKHPRSISYYLKKGYPEKVYLKQTIPLSILYLTCGLGQGKVQFYKDIYAKDYKVLAGMEKNSP